MELLSSSDVYRIIKKKLKDKGYNVTIECLKVVFEVYAELIYSCLANGMRVTLPNLGELYRDRVKGRKEGYYNVPNSRDEHTAFDKNMKWHKEWMDKAPDWGRIQLYIMPRIKKSFRKDTEGKL